MKQFLLFSFPCTQIPVNGSYFLSFSFINYLFTVNWVFVAAHGLSLTAEWGLLLPRAGFSLRWLLLGNTGSKHTGFGSCGVWAPYLWLTGPRGVGFSSYSEACWIFLHQGSTLCPHPWWADSWPLDHQRSSLLSFVKFLELLVWTICEGGLWGGWIMVSL